MKRHIQRLLLLLTCIALLLPGCSKASEPLPPQPKAQDSQSVSVQEISMTDAVQAWRSRNAVFLDVRTPEEYREGHIPGSVLIPLSELDKKYAQVPADKPVLIVCRSGNRSMQANLLLQKYGLSNTRSIKGGMLDWTEIVEK